MEEQIAQNCEQSLSVSKRHSLRALSSIRSLINNPNTSNSTLSSLLETLTRSLQLTDSDSLTRHHELTLLAGLSLRHPHFSPLISNSLRSNSLLFSSYSPRLAAAAALAVISDHTVDDRFFVSLCFASSVSVRLWLLRNAERFNVRPHLLFTVCLGLTKDPYPYVREAALNGLVCLLKHVVFEDVDLIQGCCCRAVELLRDHEDCVRCAAVRVVSEWGKMLIACIDEKNRIDCLDVVFIQLCSMIRDMRMEVRVEAFNALGKVGMISEIVLLQTLSKKVLGATKEKKFHSLGAAECFEISASAAAGTFVHGFEDEFYEVRKSACSSLGSLVILSEKFAGEALNLLVDMLNDDSVTVRLQALETMHIMVTCEHLNLEDKHMHMDEADVFSVLFFIGRSHGNFAACIIKEIEPDSDDKLGFDNARVAAFLVLAISVPLSCEQNVRSIPPQIFSYAVTLLGRISYALSDVMNQHSLMAYLSLCSRLSNFSEANFKGEDTPLHEAKSDDPNCTTEVSIGADIHMQKSSDEASKSRSWIHGKLKETATSRCQLEEEDEIWKALNIVLAKVRNVWSLVQSGFSKEALRILSYATLDTWLNLRACKEEVLTFKAESRGFDGALLFSLQYFKVLKLLTKGWEQFVPAKNIHHYEQGELEFLLGKLDRSLRELRCRFLGLSKEEELHVLELMLVSCLLRLSKFEICFYYTTMRNLSSTISHLEFLHQQGSTEPSNFVTAVKKSLFEINISHTSYRPSLFNQLLNSFSLSQLVFHGRLEHVHAELGVPDNSSENPVIFVSGLPVSIPFEITLYNISSVNRLWLRMTMSDETTQFVFLDSNLLGGCKDAKKFTYVAPFYRTPKASFTLRVCIGMECLFEDIHSVKGNGGPKRALAYLCNEKEVYFSRVSRG
ncbi:protein SIEL [Citrus sinensis]|uniref:Protein SIEL n=1 Tax=Citrus sinensis TaxID=2711 RepID=A0ACB8JL05_CITSI|nr:protein SIEL [Citrus sinensis]